MTTFPSKRRFVHDPEHRTKRGEGRAQAPKVPEILLDLLHALPPTILETTCGELGHPSFWLAPGFRYRCLCEEVVYHD